MINGIQTVRQWRYPCSSRQTSMVPTDFSQYSDKALQQALDIGKQYNARVHVSHVVHEHFHRGFMEFSLGDDMMQLFKDHTMSEAEENLAAQVAKFPRAKEVELTTAVKVGIPYEAILTEAKEGGDRPHRHCVPRQVRDGKVPDRERGQERIEGSCIPCSPGQVSYRNCSIEKGEAADRKEAGLLGAHITWTGSGREGQRIRPVSMPAVVLD